MIAINVYRSAGSWYCAWWIDGNYDGNGSLDIAPDATEADAIAAAHAMPMNVAGERVVKRVDDLA